MRLIYFGILSFYCFNLQSQAKVYELSLESSQKKALQRSYLLDASTQELEQSKENLRQHYWTLAPSLAFEHSKKFASIDGSYYDQGTSTALTLTQRLPNPFAWPQRGKSLRLSLDISKKKELLARMQVQQTIRDHYITALLLDKKLQKVKENFSLALDITNLSEKAYKHGQASIIDVKRSQIEEKTLRVKLASQQRLLDVKMNEFKRALGLDITDDVKLTTKLTFDQKLSKLSKTMLDSFTEASRVKVLEISHFNYQRTYADSRAKAFFYVPDLSFTASHSFNSRTSYSFDLTWKIFNQRMDYSSFQLAVLEKEKEKALYEESQKQYFDRSDEKISELINLKQDYESQQAIAKDLKEILQASQESFFKGLLKAQDLNLDLKSYLLQQEALLDVERELLLKLSSFAVYLENEGIFDTFVQSENS